MALYSIWTQADSPPNTQGNDSRVHLGVVFSPSIDCNGWGVRFWAGASATGDTCVIQMFRSDTAALTGGTAVVPAAVGWVSAELPSYPALTAGSNYMAVVTFPSGGYGYTSGLLSSGGVTAGPLTALSQGAATGAGFGGNCCYRYSDPPDFAMPSSSGGGTFYWVDPIVTDATADGGTIPILG